MEASRCTDGSVELRVTWDELRILSSSVNEAIEALPASDIHTRMGATPQEVRDVRAAFRRIREQLKG